MILGRRTPVIVTREQALPGRPDPLPDLATQHAVLGTSMQGPWPQGTEVIHLAAGCFWGLERIMWQQPGVVTTAVGYMGGFTPHPTYEETCTGRTGHTETVLVAYDPARADLGRLLAAFWENHDPTTANRQGNDIGTQYRSAVYWTTDEQREAVLASRDAFQQALDAAGRGTITTELRPAGEAGPFFHAEGYHQQYLHTNPGGYCNHGYKGVSCPVGIATMPAQTQVRPPRGIDGGHR